MGRAALSLPWACTVVVLPCDLGRDASLGGGRRVVQVVMSVCVCVCITACYDTPVDPGTTAVCIP